jgi:hypothetical protein
VSEPVVSKEDRLLDIVALFLIATDFAHPHKRLLEEVRDRAEKIMTEE